MTKKKILKKVVRKKTGTHASALIEREKNLDSLTPIANASIRLNLILGGLNILFFVAFVAMAIAYANKPVKERYIIQDMEGRIIGQLRMNSEPLATKTKISARVDECMRDTFNIDFVNYKKQLSKAQPCYTEKGFDELIDNFVKAGIDRDITGLYAIGDIQPIDNMRVVDSGTDAFGREVNQVKGSYQWQLKNGQKGKGVKNLNYRLDIEVITLEAKSNVNPHGFAINRLTVKVNARS